MNATALILVDLQAAAFGGFGIRLSTIPTICSGTRAPCCTRLAPRACPSFTSSTAPIPEKLLRRERGWPIVPPLVPEGSEPVVRKRARNAFEGTDLHARLQAIGARSLVVAGLQTERCVAATCRGRSDLATRCSSPRTRTARGPMAALRGRDHGGGERGARGRGGGPSAPSIRLDTWR